MANVVSTTVAVTCEDGSIALLHFILNDGRNVQRVASADAINAEIVQAATPRADYVGWPSQPAKDVSGNLIWQLVNVADLPADRTYRNAWVNQAGFIVHDMAKARAIHRERIRRVRRGRFETIDAAWSRACAAYVAAKEAGQLVAANSWRDQMATHENQRQQLRDAPQDPGIDTATTIDQLKAVWPAILNG